MLILWQDQAVAEAHAEVVASAVAHSVEALAEVASQVEVASVEVALAADPQAVLAVVRIITHLIITGPFSTGQEDVLM